MAMVSFQLSNSSALTSTAAGRPFLVIITSSSVESIFSTSWLNLVLTSERGRIRMLVRILTNITPRAPGVQVAISARRGKIAFVQICHRCTEGPQCSQHPAGIVQGGFDPDVQVL